MRYRCGNCGRTEWRGCFPERTFHPRYVIFHGVALGISSCIIRSLLNYKTQGFRGGMVMLGGCFIIMLLIYGFAIVLESCIVAARGCTSCKSHRMVISK
jgi:hypothetical protein